MKAKVSEASGPVLDWMVAKCIVGLEMSRLRVRHGRPELLKDGGEPRGARLPTNYSTDWAQGGQIIEQKKIAIWTADGLTWHAREFVLAHTPVMDGPTPLIAAMRCFVASKLGEEVEVPDELA